MMKANGPRKSTENGHRYARGSRSAHFGWQSLGRGAGLDFKRAPVRIEDYGSESSGTLVAQSYDQPTEGAFRIKQADGELNRQAPNSES